MLCYNGAMSSHERFSQPDVRPNQPFKFSPLNNLDQYLDMYSVDIYAGGIATDIQASLRRCETTFPAIPEPVYDAFFVIDSLFRNNAQDEKGGMLPDEVAPVLHEARVALQAKNEGKPVPFDLLVGETTHRLEEMVEKTSGTSDAVIAERNLNYFGRMKQSLEAITSFGGTIDPLGLSF